MPPRRSTRNKNKATEKNDSKINKTELSEPEEENNEPPKKITKSIDEDEIPEELENAKSIYDFTAKDINGDEVSLEKYKGHVCIIVNVASKCGHTKSNYEQFVELFDKYSEEKGLKILAFPCNQFGKQEPGDAEKICEFAKKRNVLFDMFDKINVNGKNAHPLWKFLTSKISGPKGKNIDWNFTKFIIDKEGQVAERHKPSVKPMQMVEFLEKYW